MGNELGTIVRDDARFRLRIQLPGALQDTILFATDPPYLVDYDGTNHPPNQRHKAKDEKEGTTGANGDWSATYGVTWVQPGAGALCYVESEPIIRQAARSPESPLFLYFKT